MQSPTFSRGEVAKILNVVPLTIANREKQDRYPAPKRDLNGYRIYSLKEVFHLQLITFNQIDPRPVSSVLYDKGVTNAKEVSKLIDSALAILPGNKSYE